MTLQEHAKKIWRDGTTPFHNCFEGLDDKQKIPLYEQVYGELHSALLAEKEIVRKLEWDLKQERERVGYMLKALVRGAESLGLGATGKGTMFSEIADVAIEKLNCRDYDAKCTHAILLLDHHIHPEKVAGLPLAPPTDLVEEVWGRLKTAEATAKRAEACMPRIADALGMKNARYSEIADKAVERLESHGELREELDDCRVALLRIADALGLERENPTWVADKAVRVIHEQKVAIDAIERLRVRCWSLKSDPDSIVDQALAELTRLREGEAKQPKPPKKAVYRWEMEAASWKLFRDTAPVGYVRRSGFIVFPIPFEWRALTAQQPFWVKAASLPLAKAAVEAVVRAHYGDAE